jgi:hypothetical protein
MINVQNLTTVTDVNREKVFKRANQLIKNGFEFVHFETICNSFPYSVCGILYTGYDIYYRIYLKEN